MKFKKLVSKTENLVSKYEQGGKIKPEKLEQLRQLLREKQSRYEVKLAATLEPDKRKKLETRLKVVAAQIAKSKHVSPAG